MAAALAVGILAGPLAAPAARADAGPAPVSDLAAQLIDSVVNIATSQNVSSDDDDDDVPSPPEGTPFQELFNDFFKDRKGTKRARRSSSLGSGFVLDPSGVIVTNNHVIEGADFIEVVFTDGSKLPAKILGRDKKVDLAVLKVEPTKPLKAAKFGDSDQMRVGDWALAIGNPFGLGGSVTLGIISAVNRDINSSAYDNYLQTDAAINRGNSGGPLFNMKGEVIGINTAIISPTGGSIGIGFSVPSSTAAPIVDQLREFGEVRRGWIGVRIQIVTDEIADSLGMPSARGALVSGVDDKGPAKTAGLEPGDVIVSFDGHDIKQMRDLPRRVASTPVGRTVNVVLLRHGQTLTRQITMARLADDEKPVKASTGAPDKAPTVKPALTLGLELSGLTDALRTKYKLPAKAKGVLVTGVTADSPASEHDVKPGELILQVSQQRVETPQDVAQRFDDLRKAGMKQALLMLSNGSGDMRFVAIPLM